MAGFAQWQSKMLGRAAAWAVCRRGGVARDVDGLRACRAARWFLPCSGIQLGDVFVTKLDLDRVSAALIVHEKHHRDAQWRRYGWVFGLMYVAAHAWDVWLRRRGLNRYELAAELASDWGGGYKRPPGYRNEG